MVEYERQQCKIKKQNNASVPGEFMVYDNSDFKLCHTMHTKLLYPSNATNSIIEACAKYRSSNRLPGFTFYDYVSKSVMYRCS